MIRHNQTYSIFDTFFLFCSKSEVTTYGRIRGLILRSQLIVILQRKRFNETWQDWDEITASLFKEQYPRFPTIEVIKKLHTSAIFIIFLFVQQIEVEDHEKPFFVDLRPFMNPSPYTVLHVGNQNTKGNRKLICPISVHISPKNVQIVQGAGTTTFTDSQRH